MQPNRVAVALPLLLAPLLGCLPGGCARGVRVERTGARVVELDFERVKLAFDIDVHNPTSTPIAAPRYALYLRAERHGETFHHVEGTAGSGLPAERTTTLTAPVEIPYRKLWKKAKWLEHRSVAPYRLEGTLRCAVEGQERRVEFSHQGSFPILQAPEYTDLHISAPSKLVLAPVVEFHVHARIRNPNPFEIDIRGLRYDLSLGGVDVAGAIPESDPVIGPGQSVWLLFTVRAKALLMLRPPGKLGLSVSGPMKTPYGTVRLDTRIK